MRIFNIVFPVDNGMMDGMTGTQLMASYSIKNKKITWKNRSDMKKGSERIVYMALSLIPLGSPLIIVPIMKLMGESSKVSIVEKFGYSNTILFPAVIGLILAAMLHIYLNESFSRNGQKVDEPILNVRLKYMTEMINVTVRKNISGDMFPPYVASLIALLFVVFIAIPIGYWMLMTATVAESILAIIILSVLWFVIGFSIEAIIRTSVMVKFEKQWTIELKKEK